MKRLGNTRELLYRLGVVLKGLDGILEAAGGIALWALSPGLILHWVEILIQDEIAKNPNDLVAHYLSMAASHFSVSGKHFLTIYLLAHGIVKIFVVIALLKNKVWAFPVAIFIFGGFVVYQLYRFAIGGSAGLILLSGFDLLVIWLIWMEYRARKPRPHQLRAAAD